MQTSTITYKNLNSELRIDAEYYRAEVLDKLEILANKDHDSLGNIASFVVGPFGSTVKVEQYVEKSEFRYVRNKDINDFSIGDDDPSLISESVFSSLPQFHIRENDLLITVVGTLGKVAIARKKDTKSIFSCKSTIIRAEAIDPYYLLTYLNSETGQIFALRGIRGAIQQGLNLSDLKEIKVYIASPTTQQHIRDIVTLAFKSSEVANQLYSQAEQIILSELGLIDWKPKHKLSFIRNFSDSKTADRIDAEYYQPMYDELIEKVTQYGNGYKTLDDLVSIKKCIEPGSEAYEENGIPFLRVSNLSKFGINNNNQQYISESLYEKLKSYQPRKGEILLSKDASPGIAYYLSSEPAKMIPSGGILRLKLKDTSKICPEYLTLVLNSIVVQKQIERDIGGSVINHWLVDQVKKALIPILPDTLQKEISNTIADSFTKREQSKKLLDIAKRGVEIAIEQGEEEAEKWLHEQVNYSSNP